MKVRVPADIAVDPEVDLCSGDDGYFLKLDSMSACRARSRGCAIDHRSRASDVSLLKSHAGNIDVTTNLV